MLTSLESLEESDRGGGRMHRRAQTTPNNWGGA